MYTPELKIINFKHNSGDCEGIPYMDMRNTESGVTTIQTGNKTVWGLHQAISKEGKTST